MEGGGREAEAELESKEGRNLVELSFLPFVHIFLCSLNFLSRHLHLESINKYHFLCCECVFLTLDEAGPLRLTCSSSPPPSVFTKPRPSSPASRPSQSRFHRGINSIHLSSFLRRFGRRAKGTANPSRIPSFLFASSPTPPNPFPFETSTYQTGRWVPEDFGPSYPSLSSPSSTRTKSPTPSVSKLVQPSLG